MKRVSSCTYLVVLLPALLSPLPMRSATLAPEFCLLQTAAEAGKVGSPEPPQKPLIVIKVIDENGVSVMSARVTLIEAKSQLSARCETDYTGRCEMKDLESGTYRLEADKENFYSTTLNDLQVSEAQQFEVTLNHLQEYAETVNVVDSPEGIDPQQTASSRDLGYREIINLPYPTTRDIRGAFPFIPGVLADATGQIHVGGSETYQIVDQLDGFDITQPISGQLELRVSADALRSMGVQSSRYSTQYGRGSGGVADLVTGMGDDRYRFSATNFVPSIQTRKGLHLNEWTPRATFSGPLRKNKAWFFDAADGEYDLNIIEELPAGADQNPVWRFSNLSKVQVNLNSTNSLTTSFLINGFHAAHTGLSALNPLETTLDQRQEAYLFTVKDQAYLSKGLLLEVGFGLNQYNNNEQPLGDLPYMIRPEGTSGNYYRTANGLTRRLQGIADLTLPVLRWHGRHELKLGTDTEQTTYSQAFSRLPVFILREDGSLSRKITFLNSPRFDENDLQWSGFVQDRWSVTDRWLLETGIRLEGDQIVRQPLFSPRLASSYELTQDGKTKLTGGVGLYFDRTNLDFITRPLAGQRLDTFFAADGQTPVGQPLLTSFQVNQHDLEAPRFVNWSLGLERQLRALGLWRIEYLQKRGSRGFTFVNPATNLSGELPNLLELTNQRQDRYDSIELTMRRHLRGSGTMRASYTRSIARSNAVLDFNLDNLTFGQQAGGPLPWDSPNRLLSWGWMPLVRKFDLAYSLEWRDGFPFSLVNQGQQLVGPPDSRRFPAYFSLNLHAERRFRILGGEWALRAGFNNITSRSNPTVVNNNIDSPLFLTYAGAQHRVFTARIRFLGRK